MSLIKPIKVTGKDEIPVESQSLSVNHKYPLEFLHVPSTYDSIQAAVDFQDIPNQHRLLSRSLALRFPFPLFILLVQVIVGLVMACGLSPAPLFLQVEED